MNAAPQPGWRAESYFDLMALLRQRKRLLGLTNLEIDARGGLPSGYFGKILCGHKHAGIESLGRILTALGIDLVVVPKPVPGAMETAVDALERKKAAAILGRAGVRKRNLMLSAERRREIAKLASLTRWRREVAIQLLTCGPRGGRRRPPPPQDDA